MTPASCHLTLLRLRVHAISHGLQWSGLPGSLLHGMLGKVLREQNPEVYADLIGPLDTGPGNDIPRPLWLQPPLDPRAVYAPGDGLQFDLLLANPRPAWLAALERALPEIGRQGVGKTRGRFTLQSVTPVAWHHDAAPGPITLDDMLREPRGVPCGPHLMLQCLTPLRIKSDGGLLRQPPPAPLLLRRLLARASMLAACPLHALPLASEALDQARQLQLADHQLQWDDLSRYSARQEAVLPLGGLTGWLGYQASSDAELTAARAWLHVGEWLHIGGKTSFGLGLYRVSPPRQG